MRLLVGLGNPGDEYHGSRHNVGFAALDKVAKALAIQTWKEFKDGLLALTTMGTEKIALFKPMQYMNNSGVQVRQVLDYYDIPSTNLAVIYDDVYVEPGSARMRQSGGDGGHNGVKSLYAHIPTEDFWRIRVGAGLYEQDPEQKHHLPPLETYVLQHLPAHDAKKVADLIDKLVPDLLTWLEHGNALSQKTIHI